MKNTAERRQHIKIMIKLCKSRAELNMRHGEKEIRCLIYLFKIGNTEMEKQWPPCD